MFSYPVPIKVGELPLRYLIYYHPCCLVVTHIGIEVELWYTLVALLGEVHLVIRKLPPVGIPRMQDRIIFSDPCPYSRIELFYIIKSLISIQSWLTFLSAGIGSVGWAVDYIAVWIAGIPCLIG